MGCARVGIPLVVVVVSRKTAPHTFRAQAKYYRDAWGSLGSLGEHWKHRDVLREAMETDSFFLIS